MRSPVVQRRRLVFLSVAVVTIMLALAIKPESHMNGRSRSPLALPDSSQAILPDPGPRSCLGPTLWATPPSPATPAANPIPAAQAGSGAETGRLSAAGGALPAPPAARVMLPFVSNDPGYLGYGKKGIGDAWQAWGPDRLGGDYPGTNLRALDYAWVYDWSFSYLPARDQDVRYVRMIWCQGGLWQKDVNGVSHYAGDVAASDYQKGLAGRVWLVYNEPDEASQCNLADASAAADYYGTVYDVIKGNDPTARVFGGGLLWLNTSYTRNWWTAFIARLRSTGSLYKLEGVHVHLYPRLSTAPTRQAANCASPYCMPELAQVAGDWYQAMHVGLGLGDRPIWITETGWLGGSSCTAQEAAQVVDGFVKPWSQWFAGDSSWPYTGQAGLNPGYAAIAWYATRDLFGGAGCSYLLDALGQSGAPTLVGSYWNGFRP